MKRIMFFAGIAAALFCLGFSIWCFYMIPDTFGRWYMGLLCLLAAVAYGFFSYEKRPWANAWA